MDKKAKKILIQTYWTSSGWKSGGFTFTNEDFNYAKSKGVMFDPLSITHDECIGRLRAIHEGRLTQSQVVNAFLHSLSTRKVHLRSALSSWALTKELPLHSYGQPKAAEPMYSACEYCNEHKLMSNEHYVDEDLNILNFERIKWGGVRLNWLVYCLLDLELLCREEEHTVSEEDIAILKSMLEAVEACGENEAARQLEKRWKGIFPSSKDERDQVMEIWGYAGLLQSTDDYRKERGRGTDFNSMATWRGIDGYRRDKVDEYFGGCLGGQRS
ncbi:hypothetical protein Q5741_15110 [Paenibacillus sp. JX-17]|uniref:Uncharacterized protein n=1 Tax=Paenibacillus lacisoli TaxID=3064525 RepID=A0ABT9CEN7_9BACL|nr:hypothetical protein [Paenibacillus sp. JX-17]MDO7907739.1 hypothetical protein [Paenibacillus sp. JX-17]